MSLRMGVMVLGLLLAGASYTAPRRARSNPPTDAWVKAKVDALVRAARAAFNDDRAVPRYESVLRSIDSAIRRRKLAEDEAFAARYREFIDFVQTASLDQRPDHELGFVVTDRQYFAETRAYVQIPEFLINQNFLRWVSRFETLDRAKLFLRQLNSTRDPSDQLLFFSYKSQHLGAPDNDDSFWRLLIVVPGNEEGDVPEKWVQFGVTDPGARTRIRNVSVVSAIPRPDGTFNAYFKDSFRTYRRDGSIGIKGRWELGYGDDNCAKCHKSGVLPIFPEPGSVSPNEERVVSTVNRRLRAYGSPRFDKYLDESKLGPGLGSGTWHQRARRFGEEFNKTDVGQAMGCASCHRQDAFGTLNWPMDQVLVGTYVKGGQMPMGCKLEAAQREELYQSLIEEYFAIDDGNPGILKSWLLGRLR